MGHYTAKWIEKECEQCKKSFRVRESLSKTAPCRFCSRECLFASMRNRIDRTCEYCGAEFVTIPRQIKLGGAKYCSNECRYLANRGSGHSSWRGGTVGYRGENWLQQRHLAWERDKGICQHCGKKPAKGKKRFDVHHIKPFREFGGDYVTANQLINLITLCPTCHKLAEHRIISIQPYLF